MTCRLCDRQLQPDDDEICRGCLQLRIDTYHIIKDAVERALALSSVTGVLVALMDARTRQAPAAEVLAPDWEHTRWSRAFDVLSKACDKIEGILYDHKEIYS